MRSLPPHTIVGVRTPYYENTSVRCRRLMGMTRRRDATHFIFFIRLPGGGGVLRRLCIRCLPVASRCPSFCRFWTWSKRAVGRNGPSPSPRVVLLSALFVAAVQSCRRRCVVRRCSNRRIAIRNHASYRRRLRPKTTLKQRLSPLGVLTSALGLS